MVGGVSASYASDRLSRKTPDGLFVPFSLLTRKIAEPLKKNFLIGCRACR